MSEIEKSYANRITNEQQLNQINNVLYSYCKVMRVPKLGVAPIVITVLTGLILTLLIAALGESLLIAVAVGTIVSAVLAFLCWLAYRYRVGASKRLNAFLAEDGGRMMITTLPRHSIVCATSLDLEDIICLSKAELYSGLTALPI